MHRIMLFIDLENFKAGFKEIRKERGEDRIEDLHKIHNFVKNFLRPNYPGDLVHIRTYIYTGEYGDNLLNKIKDSIEKVKKCKEDKMKKFYEKTIKRKEGQKKFFNKCSGFRFFEIKKRPLQFDVDKGIFQKGVDVQLAVDLVSHAFLNNYDIAILFSGDIDLLESLKTVKSLGKHVIVISHFKNTAKEIMREADLYVDLQKLESSKLDEFSHIFKK